MDSHSRRPPLSILVPNSSFTRPDLPSPAKQKRLFPIACRVVPTDQWFTTRIDRTWIVKDLKVWLLSKALPPGVLPLPASYRPSSPVTFAAAPPTASAEPSTAAVFSASPSLDDATPLDTTDTAQDQDLPPRPRPNLGTPQPTPPSIPYSYNTGTPAISGIQALKNRHPGPSTDDSEFVQNILQIADKWSLYSFSLGGMLLVDTSPLSEYSLNPHELLELHRAGAYVRLPRTIQPPLPDPMPFPLSLGYTRTASARAGATITKPKFEKPPQTKPSHKNRKHALLSEANVIAGSSSSLHGYTTRHGQLSSTSSECESDQDTEDFEEIYGSPYAQPYYDGWAMVLRIRGLSSAKKGGDKGKARDEENGVSRCDGVDSPGPASSSTGTETWKKMWIMVRESRISVRRHRAEDEDESWFVGNCVGVYGMDKLKYLLGHDPPSSGTIRRHHPSQTITHRASPEPLPYRVSTNSNRRSVRSGKDLTICAKFIEDSGKSRWLFLKMLDPQNHEHLLRIIHRLAYTSPLRLHSIYPNPLRHATQSISQSLSQGLDVPSSLPPLHHFRPTTHTMRTLRTDFLPNPIPHPLALSFSAPSPLAGQDDVSDDDLPLLGGRRRSLFDTTDFASNNNEDLFGDDDSISGGYYHPPVSASSFFTTSSSSYGMGLGPGMGMQFPEWREEVLIRAVNAGLGGGVGMGSLDRRAFVSHLHHRLSDTDGDNDDDNSDNGDHQDLGYRSNDFDDYRRTLTQSPPPSLHGAQESTSSFHTKASSFSRTAVDSVNVSQDGLGVLDDTDSDSDSEAGSEREWEGWAYDLDRLKGVRYHKVRGAGSGVGGVGGAGGSDEDREQQHYHYRYHHDMTTNITSSSSPSKKIRRTGRRDRAKTISAGNAGVTPTPMPTPIIPSSVSGAGGDLFSSFSAFSLQSSSRTGGGPLPLSPTKVASSTTLSSNSTITPERDGDNSNPRRKNKDDCRDGGGGGGDLTNKPSSPTIAKTSPLTRARSATVSAVAAVRSPTSSSSSNAQSRQPSIAAAAAATTTTTTSKAKASSSGGGATAGSDKDSGVSSSGPGSGAGSGSGSGSGIGPGPGPGSGSGGGIVMKNLMRGLSMKAGKGLENALDFVEGK